jgi:uracil-DNA glycosylase
MNPSSYKQQLLNALYTPFKGCSGCHFNMPKATQIVFGEGNPNSPLLFIGEAPGREEDLQGKPFVGKSGKLLNRILDTTGITRNDVFITNIVKCRPPNNRRPLPQEIEASKPLLYGQIKIIHPSVICTLGAAALEGILGEPVKITKKRGKPIRWHNITIFPTYHPAYILRNPQELQTFIHDIDQAVRLSKKTQASGG